MALKNKDEQGHTQGQTQVQAQGEDPRQARRDAEARQREANDTREQRDADKREGKLTSELAEPHKGDTRYFEGSVTKIDKEGRTVMSDHLEEGDRLRRETTDRYKASGLDPAADQ